LMNIIEELEIYRNQLDMKNKNFERWKLE
jgi:hypothetical protein